MWQPWLEANRRFAWLKEYRRAQLQQFLEAQLAEVDRQFADRQDQLKQSKPAQPAAVQINCQWQRLYSFSETVRLDYAATVAEFARRVATDEFKIQLQPDEHIWVFILGAVRMQDNSRPPTMTFPRSAPSSSSLSMPAPKNHRPPTASSIERE